MKLTNQELIDDLAERTIANVMAAEELKNLPIEILNQKSSSESWSALECIEHLNRYGDFYLKEIKKQFLTAAQVPATTEFKSGLIGNYFAKSLQAKEKLNKMKTVKNMNPNGSDLTIGVIDTFIAQQKEMLEILDRSLTISLKKNKTSISISSVLKLRLGDTLRIVIYHNQRHLAQAKKAVL
ncbi:MAG: DinB family protein [Crocinitomix sp.]|nr:DinB family protein [Crocinitomix sp.]